MKVHCPACRDIVEMKEFTTSSSGLAFNCPSCSASNFLDNPQNKNQTKQVNLSNTKDVTNTDTDLLAGEEVNCPKCGNRQKDPYACHRCGLVFSRADSGKLPETPPELKASWDQIENDLENEKLHDSFLDACLNIDRFDYAARQYRLLSHRPDRQRFAEQMLKKIAAHGQAQLPAHIMSKGHKKNTTRTGKLIIWMIALIGVGLLLYYVLNLSNFLDLLNP